MNKEAEKKPSSGTLKLRSSSAKKIALGQESLNTGDLPAKEDTIAQHAPKFNFSAIYNQLHGKFPEIINLDKPVLLAVGIRKQMAKETGISSITLKRWIAKYFRKSNYYAKHIAGSERYNLDGTEAGIVTEKHQEKMDKFLEKIKNSKSNALDTDNHKSKDFDK